MKYEKFSANQNIITHGEKGDKLKIKWQKKFRQPKTRPSTTTNLSQNLARYTFQSLIQKSSIKLGRL